MNVSDCDCENIELREVCLDYILSLATMSSLFLVSEVLPFLKSQKGNGLVEVLICCFQGSECLLTKIISSLKGENSVENKGQEQIQSIKTDDEHNLTNSINITIQK